MGERITKVHFAQSCIRIGRFAAQWGADSLDLHDDLDQPEKPENVFRFTDEMRRRLRYLDECADAPTPAPRRMTVPDFRTNIEKVAEAITALTYGEMIEVGASLRDIISDRLSDKPDAFSNAMEVADLLHSWAAAQLVDEENDRG